MPQALSWVYSCDTSIEMSQEVGVGFLVKSSQRAHADASLSAPTAYTQPDQSYQWFQLFGVFS